MFYAPSKKKTEKKKQRKKKKERKKEKRAGHTHTYTAVFQSISGGDC